jgi:hypothetical protein
MISINSGSVKMTKCGKHGKPNLNINYVFRFLKTVYHIYTHFLENFLTKIYHILTELFFFNNIKGDKILKNNNSLCSYQELKKQLIRPLFSTVERKFILDYNGVQITPDSVSKITGICIYREQLLRRE